MNQTSVGQLRRFVEEQSIKLTHSLEIHQTSIRQLTPGEGQVRKFAEAAEMHEPSVGQAVSIEAKYFELSQSFKME